MTVKLDIVFICIIMIVIVSIATISINNSIDNKLSNISINIPPVNIPKSTVIINLDKGRKVKAEIDLNTVNNNEPILEGFDAIKSEVNENKNKSNVNKNKCNKKEIKKNQINCKPAFKPTTQYSIMKPIVGKLEDYKMKGSNYTTYNDTVPPKDVGMRLLPSHNKKLYPHLSTIPKYPQAKNYMFI